MDFALVAVIFLFLSLPGIAFRRGYYSSRFSISFISNNVINETIWSLVPAYIFQTLGLWFINTFLSYDFDVKYIGYLLSGVNDPDSIKDISISFHDNLINIFKYNFYLTFFAYITGNIIRIIVRSLNLDILTRLFRYPNRWHYFFTGEYKMIEDKSDLIKDAFSLLLKGEFRDAYYAWKIYKKITFLMVDVLVSLDGENVLYNGKFEDYYLAPHGGLDRIVIKYPSKKIFSSKGRGKFRDIPSDFLIIPYKEIKNLNFSYIFFDKGDKLDEKGKSMLDSIVVDPKDDFISSDNNTG